MTDIDTVWNGLEIEKFANDNYLFSMSGDKDDRLLLSLLGITARTALPLPSYAAMLVCRKIV